MRVVPVKLFTDNYAYLLIPSSGKAALVDPADPQPVLDACCERQVEVSTILTTHRHRDHAGGNLQLKAQLPGVVVVGGKGDKVPGAEVEVEAGQKLQVGSVTVESLATPYHTDGHVCYLCRDGGQPGQPPVLFSGDALFVGGCGRCFWGTPQQMYDTLIGVLAALPAETLVYCGHEYTVANLEFAATIEPNNEALAQKLQWAKDTIAAGQPTVPSTIQEELTYNPYMRCQKAALLSALGCSNPVHALAEVRSRKDHSTRMASAMTYATKAIVGTQQLAGKVGLPFYYL